MPTLGSCRISLMVSLGQPSSPAMAPRDKTPREGSQEHLLLPWMPSGSAECFMGCCALYPPLVLTFLLLFPTFIHLHSLVSVSPVFFFHRPCEKGGPEVLLEGADICRVRERNARNGSSYKHVVNGYKPSNYSSNIPCGPPAG